MKTATKKAPAKKAVSKARMVTAKPDAAEGLRELMMEQLKDIYWAEKALVKALPKLKKNASSPDLREAITEHLEVTQTQVKRLEEVFRVLGKKAQTKKCVAMEGLIKEGEEVLESTEKGVVRDAGIISASQKVEHYEIATYGTLAAFANTLGEMEAAALLEETLNEEKTADETLSKVALDVNPKASEAGEEEDERYKSNGTSKKKK